METLIGLILFVVIAFFVVIYVIFETVLNKLRLILGYKKYEYTKILSHGMKNIYMWHKEDEKALEHYKNFEFVSEVKPNRKILKSIIIKKIANSK